MFRATYLRLQVVQVSSRATNLKKNDQTLTLSKIARIFTLNHVVQLSAPGIEIFLSRQDMRDAKKKKDKYLYSNAHRTEDFINSKRVLGVFDIYFTSTRALVMRQYLSGIGDECELTF